MAVIPGTGMMISWSIIAMSAPHEAKVVMVTRILYWRVLLRKIEPTTAPTAPKSINPTAESEITVSLNPKGLIRKFELEPNIRKLP